MHSFLKDRNPGLEHTDLIGFCQQFQVCLCYKMQYLMGTTLKMNQSNFWLLFQFRSSYSWHWLNLFWYKFSKTGHIELVRFQLVRAQNIFSFRFVSITCAYDQRIHEKQ